MSTAASHRRMTREEYLAFEETAEVRHEFYRGEVFAMPGGSSVHSRLKVNLVTLLNSQTLRGKCSTFDSDMRIKVTSTGLYTYPDASVVCDHPRFEDETGRTLLNPRAIFEVLSPSSERYDRGRKFRQYGEIPSLQYYVLVAQDEPRLELFTRQEGALWSIGFSKGLDSVLDLPAIGCVIPLADLYISVDLRKAEVEDAPYETDPLLRPGE